MGVLGFIDWLLTPFWCLIGAILEGLVWFFNQPLPFENPIKDPPEYYQDPDVERIPISIWDGDQVE